EVIPFFKTLKEHFKGIQKALTTEIKEMKAIFDELEAEVDQNAVNRKCDEIERKNLLIKNDTLIANFLSKEVFYIATNSELNETHSEACRALNFRALDFQITQITRKVLVLQEQNELFKVKNAKVKQHYKELYDPVKIMHAKHIDQTTALLTENENLKVQINAKLKCITIDFITPKVLAPGMYVIDVEPIPPRLRNNREVHLDYLKHLKESVETLREIVEEAKVERPLDRSLASACLYTKHSQELLEYAAQNIWQGIAHSSGISWKSSSGQLDLRMTTLVLSWVPRTPQQNGVVERQNHTLVEAARTMLIFSKASMFLWAEVVATACYTPVSPTLVVPFLVNSDGTPSSTSIDQDAPSPSHLSSSSALQSPCLHQGVAAEPTLMGEIPFVPVDNDPFINIFALEPTSEASSSEDASSA
nr:putative ribonuclease H-like domain-containing protein [Tanacetum cinerariifolium]